MRMLGQGRLYDLSRVGESSSSWFVVQLRTIIRLDLMHTRPDPADWPRPTMRLSTVDPPSGFALRIDCVQKYGVPPLLLLSLIFLSAFAYCAHRLRRGERL